MLLLFLDFFFLLKKKRQKKDEKKWLDTSVESWLVFSQAQGSINSPNLLYFISCSLHLDYYSSPKCFSSVGDFYSECVFFILNSCGRNRNTNSTYTFTLPCQRKRRENHLPHTVSRLNSHSAHISGTILLLIVSNCSSCHSLREKEGKGQVTEETGPSRRGGAQREIKWQSFQPPSKTFLGFF